jgi:hypothetical protein
MYGTPIPYGQQLNPRTGSNNLYISVWSALYIVTKLGTCLCLITETRDPLHPSVPHMWPRGPHARTRFKRKGGICYWAVDLGPGEALSSNGNSPETVVGWKLSGVWEICVRGGPLNEWIFYCQNPTNVHHARDELIASYSFQSKWLLWPQSLESTIFDWRLGNIKKKNWWSSFWFHKSGRFF